MKSLVFDTGPIISITMNNLLWLLPYLKKQFKGEFYITHMVKKELIDIPLNTKKFKFEALQTLRLLNKKILRIVPEKDIDSVASQLLEIANHVYTAKHHAINIVHRGEMESVAAAIHLNASGMVVDERTTRKLLEDPLSLRQILERKLHTPVDISSQHLKQFKKLTKQVKVIRSFELVTVAYEIGLLNKYLPFTPHPDKTLLEAVLWGVKLNGCAVSEEEIRAIVKVEARR